MGILRLNTGKSGVIEYLSSGLDTKRLNYDDSVITRDDLDTRVSISGNIRSTNQIINDLNKSKNWSTNYYHISYSFSEDLSIEDIKKIEQETREFFLSGYNDIESNAYAELHQPKDNAKYKLWIGKSEDGKSDKYKLLSENEADEYIKSNPSKKHLLQERFTHFHMVIPKVNLLTNTQLKITEKDERNAINSFQEYINIKYGLSSPKDNRRDISNQQYKAEKFFPSHIELNSKDFEKLTNKQSKDLIQEDVKNAILNSEITNYDDLLNYLNSCEYISELKEVKTSKNEYIKVKIEGQEKAINLRASIFQKEFYKKDVKNQIRTIENKSIEEYQKDVARYKARREKEVSKRYDFSRKKALQVDLIEKSLKEKFENQTLKETSTEKIINDFEKGKNIFLTGGAGTGKSYSAKNIISHFEQNGQNVIKLGTTGKAASEIAGQTFHSFFGINTINSLEDLKKFDLENPKLLEKSLNNIKNCDLIAIDEISMMSANQLELVNYRLDQAKYSAKLMFIGDFCQLPPVSKDVKAEYAFESQVWKELNMTTHSLETVRRNDNQEFTNMLNRLRYGKLDKNDKSMLSSMENNKVDESKATYIFNTNQKVNEHNLKKLNELNGELETYHSSISLESDIDLSIDLKNEIFKESVFDETINLKINAPILLTINDKKLNIANGDKGVYLGMNEKNEMLVKLDRNSEIVSIPKKTIDTEIAQDNQTINVKVTNYPIKPAFAITTHKSQGMSIEHLVIDPSNTFENHQFYVAISRARDPTKTKILPFVNYKGQSQDIEKAIKIDTKVLDFYHSNIRSNEIKSYEEEIKKRLEKRKQEYLKEKKVLQSTIASSLVKGELQQRPSPNVSSVANSLHSYTSIKSVHKNNFEVHKNMGNQNQEKIEKFAQTLYEYGFIGEIEELKSSVNNALSKVSNDENIIAIQSSMQIADERLKNDNLNIEWLESKIQQIDEKLQKKETQIQAPAPASEPEQKQEEEKGINYDEIIDKYKDLKSKWDETFANTKNLNPEIIENLQKAKTVETTEFFNQYQELKSNPEFVIDFYQKSNEKDWIVAFDKELLKDERIANKLSSDTYLNVSNETIDNMKIANKLLLNVYKEYHETGKKVDDIVKNHGKLFNMLDDSIKQTALEKFTERFAAYEQPSIELMLDKKFGVEVYDRDKQSTKLDNQLDKIIEKMQSISDFEDKAKNLTEKLESVYEKSQELYKNNGIDTKNLNETQPLIQGASNDQSKLKKIYETCKEIYQNVKKIAEITLGKDQSIGADNSKELENTQEKSNQYESVFDIKRRVEAESNVKTQDNTNTQSRGR
jgi:hypothetical protein